MARNIDVVKLEWGECNYVCQNFLDFGNVYFSILFLNDLQFIGREASRFACFLALGPKQAVSAYES